MKTPNGFIYAILITVAIVAVTLFARSQGSTLVTVAGGKATPPEVSADSSSAQVKDESDAAPANSKSDDDSAK